MSGSTIEFLWDAANSSRSQRTAFGSVGFCDDFPDHDVKT
jgi:hypothetical protein